MGRLSIDITNKKFGRLKVLERAGKSAHGDILWKCMCKCGNIATPTYSSLVSGNTRSCGCLHKEILIANNKNRKSDIFNKRFGRLLVIGESEVKSKDGHYKWICKCDCGTELLVSGNSLVRGVTKSCGCINRERLLGGGETHIGWKGGVNKYNITLFKTYASRLVLYEEVRKDLNGLLELRCAYCGKWFSPGCSDVKNRLKALNSSDMSENRLYCSKCCKDACPVFNRRVWPKGFKPATSREVQPELRQLVFERDNYTCQKCWRTNNEIEIHCHHIDPVSQNPIESADMDNCITFCKDCHKEIHKQNGCGYNELRCREEY